LAEWAKDVAFLGDTASLSSANRVVPMRLPAKLHYAWIVAAVTFLLLLLTAAVRAAPGILIVPLENEFHWARSAISFAVGVNLLLYGLIGPFAAALIDRFGGGRRAEPAHDAVPAA
jgi:hypothetical protein